MSYERDQFQSFVTSASLATALAPYITSQSVSAAIAGISLGAYVTSNSLSAAVATDTLTVRGHAGVSATMSAAAVTVAGRPVGAVLLGYDVGTQKSVFGFSGSWSDFCYLELRGYVSGAGGIFPITVYTDGGTTPILTSPFPTAIGTAFSWDLEARIHGTDNAPRKFVYMRGIFDAAGGTITSTVTSTATAGFVNCIRVTLTGTASYAFMALYGWRKS